MLVKDKPKELFDCGSSIQDPNISEELKLKPQTSQTIKHIVYQCDLCAASLTDMHILEYHNNNKWLPRYKMFMRVE